MAVQVWKRWPTEIEVDLLSRGLDIADWHQGIRDQHGRMKLSSRRLLVLVEKLAQDGESEVYKAISESGWPELMDVLAKVHEDGAMLRASKFPRSELGSYTSFLPPKERLSFLEQHELVEAAREDLLDNLFGAGGDF